LRWRIWLPRWLLLLLWVPLYCCELNFYSCYHSFFGVSFFHMVCASRDVLWVDDGIVVSIEFFWGVSISPKPFRTPLKLFRI
jgi:hypothetical protein